MGEKESFLNKISPIWNLKYVWVANLRKSIYVDVTLLDDLAEKNIFALP